jgi:hypothetical protein
MSETNFISYKRQKEYKISFDYLLSMMMMVMVMVMMAAVVTAMTAVVVMVKVKDTEKEMLEGRVGSNACSSTYCSPNDLFDTWCRSLPVY